MIPAPLAFIGLGLLAGLGAMLYISTVPYTPVQFGLIETRTDPGNPMGTELKVLGYRVHHYMIGLAIMAPAAYAIVFKGRNPLFRYAAYFVLGFGSFLIIDQLPNIVGVCQWDVPCKIL